MDERNLKTEDEAKLTWCPYMRISNYDEDSGSVAINRWPEIDGGVSDCRCDASECSQWLWAPDVFDRGPKLIEVGYCGLRGSGPNA